ncbi:DUF3306 domain-containing protein [Roseibium denhamense]|uniref:DUF3306 domain-containing protein n=1 Tax=Roseibium denhamense TaxID=76305 RepID=A0ABY1NHR3_9HYPH|nr:DUF3306 domain-containing protein [Roseibium denhamense]MTI06467.1 DUF3306 domain-containing protein [Roseibium denhamense]SMP09391.1 Protein of unknown function [Roseibium denhamense]
MSDGETKPQDFWSRRKAAVRAAEAAEQDEAAAVAAAEKRAALKDKPDAEILDELELPDPDTLSDQDDFKPFLSDTVPERLRRRALRRLWTVNPVLANVDGLVDYADDFTDAATVVSNLKTVYRVGMGMFDKFAVEDQVAAGPVEGSGEVDTPHPMEAGLSSPDISLSQENAAAQKGEGQNEPASLQLTQADAIDQTQNDGADLCYDAQLEPVAETSMLGNTRKRMKFDYS